MRTTVTVEDSLFQQALDVADPNMPKADIFREALKIFIKVNASRRLAKLGGKAPEMKDVQRNRESTS